MIKAIKRAGLVGTIKALWSVRNATLPLVAIVIAVPMLLAMGSLMGALVAASTGLSVAGAAMKEYDRIAEIRRAR